MPMSMPMCSPCAPIQGRDAPQWAVIQEHAIAVHYWNRISGGRPLACGSLLHRLLEDNCVVCTPLPCARVAPI